MATQKWLCGCAVGVLLFFLGSRKSAYFLHPREYSMDPPLSTNGRVLTRPDPQGEDPTKICNSHTSGRVFRRGKMQYCVEDLAIYMIPYTLYQAFNMAECWSMLSKCTSDLQPKRIGHLFTSGAFLLFNPSHQEKREEETGSMGGRLW